MIQSATVVVATTTTQPASSTSTDQHNGVYRVIYIKRDSSYLTKKSDLISAPSAFVAPRRI